MIGTHFPMVGLKTSSEIIFRLNWSQLTEDLSVDCRCLSRMRFVFNKTHYDILRSLSDHYHRAYKLQSFEENIDISADPQLRLHASHQE